MTATERYDRTLATFADEVGPEGPVHVVGGRTQWSVGGSAASGVREVRAPSGIVGVEPAEMTVRVRAGTPVVLLLDELAAVGQSVALPARTGATVGGLLAVGRSDVRRLGLGPVRDTVLELTSVSAEGRLVRTGGPTVKNVSGYDLARLFIGSLGTLGFAAEVVLRTRPRPEASAWLAGGGVDPEALRRRLHAPQALLWDGDTVWVNLAGRAVDVAAERDVAVAAGLRPVESGPDLPAHRSSHDPGTLREVVRGARERDEPVVAEVGVGIVHRRDPAPALAVPDGVRRLNERVKQAFDPTGRLNPGRQPTEVG